MQGQGLRTDMISLVHATEHTLLDKLSFKTAKLRLSFRKRTRSQTSHLDFFIRECSSLMFTNQDNPDNKGI